ncbi:MAG: type II toxin-antitoxin system HicB family antitoxin [Thermomicrobiales bacterium]
MRYVVIFETDGDGFSAYVPDLPGCIAAGETREEVEELIREGIVFHIAGLKRAGLTVPPPTSVAESIQIPAVIAAD